MKCENCGHEIPISAKFCENCGAKNKLAEPLPWNDPVQTDAKPVAQTKKDEPIYRKISFWVACSVLAIVIILTFLSMILQNTNQNAETVTTTATASETVTDSFEELTYCVPEEWLAYRSDGDELVAYYIGGSDTDKYLISYYDSDMDYISMSFLSETIKSYENELDNYDLIDKEITVVDGRNAYRTIFKCSLDSVTHYIRQYAFAVGSRIYYVSFVGAGNSQTEWMKLHEKDVINSIDITKNAVNEILTEEPATTEPTTEEPTTEEPTAEKPTEAKDTIVNNTSTGGFSAQGTGDYVAEGLTVTGYGVLKINHTGSGNFAVISYEGDDYDDLLVNTIGNYSGEVLIDHSGTFSLEITADGSWNITSSGLSIDDSTSFSGTGDAVTGITTHDGGTWEISNSGDGNFAVIQYGLSEGYMDLLVNEIGDYSGTVKGESGDDIFFEVTSDGNWSISKK